MVRVSFSESVDLPHSQGNIDDWQNKPISLTSYSAARKIEIEGTSLELLAMFKVTNRAMIYTEEVSIKHVTVTVGEEVQSAFQVDAPKTLEAMGITDRTYLAQLTYDQKLSDYLALNPYVSRLGFDLRITNPNSDLVIEGDGSTCDKKVRYKVITLVGDSVDAPRSFHPVFDNASGPPAFPTYGLTWSKYVPPLCSSIPDQDDYDNCIYDNFSGSGDTSTIFPYYLLDSGDKYRPHMNYPTDAVNPNTNSADSNNTHTFKQIEGNSYMNSSFRRSGEFLPLAGFVPGLTESLIGGRLNDLDDYIQKFAESALDYEVVSADDGTYYVLMGAKEFTPDTDGSFVPSDDVDPFFEGTCAGFFEPLTGSPNRPLGDGKMYSWPVSSAFREPNMKVGNFVPKQTLVTSDPSMGFMLKTSTFPVFADDSVYGGYVVYYSSLFTDQLHLINNTDETHYNMTQHMFGLFATVYNFIDSMLDGTVTDFDTGYTVAEMRTECLQLLRDIISYINDPRSYTEGYLAPWFTVDADFITQTYLYDQIAVQPRDNLDELGMYNLNALAASRELPLYDNAEDHRGMLDGARHMGSMQYSPDFISRVKKLIYNKIGAVTPPDDDKVFLVCKPDVGFWSVTNHSTAGSSLRHIMPYSHWGNFDNNRMMDIFMCRISKAFMKTKWLVDLSHLSSVLSNDLKPNMQQQSLYTQATDSTASGLTWEVREEDYWKVTSKTILQMASGGTEADMGAEKNDRVYNGNTWISALGDVTFRLQFPCQAEMEALRYGDSIEVFGTNSSYTDEEGNVTDLADVRIRIDNSTGDLKDWTGGRDQGGDAEWKLTQPSTDVLTPIHISNVAGEQTVLGLGDLDNLFSLTVNPAIPFTKGDTFSWYVQGGEYIVKYSDGTQELKSMTKVPELLKYGVYVTWLFSKGVPFYPGDWWKISIDQPYGIENILEWERGNLWRSATDTDACVLFEMGTADALDAIALAGHNLSDGATVQVLGFNPADAVGYDTLSVDDLLTLWTAIPNSVEITLDHPGEFAVIQGSAPYVVYPSSTALGATEFKAYLIRITDASLDYIELSRIHAATTNQGMFEVICGHGSEVGISDSFIGQKSVARSGDVPNTDSTQFTVGWVGFMYQEDFQNIRNLFTNSKRNNSEPFIWVPNMERDDSSIYVRFRNNFDAVILDGFYRGSSLMEIRRLLMETV